MNYLDIIIAIPLLWAVYQGFTKGFVIALASLVALIAGIYCAILFSGFTGIYIDRWFSPNPKYLPLISFSVTFIVVVGIVYLIAFVIDRIIKATGMGLLNRIIGVIFNLAKMALILSVIMSLFNYAGVIKPLIPDKQKDESLLYNPISKVAPAVFPYLKFEEWKEKLKREENKPVT
jgi:membrane protein required for colicin V production